MVAETKAPEPWRVAVGRIGGLSKSARHDPVEGTAAARAGFLAKFETQVDPAGKLSPDERRRRAQAALKAHMLRLARKSAKARAARRNGAGQ